MPLPKPKDRAADRLSQLISAVVLLTLAVLVLRDLTRPAPAHAFPRGPNEPIPTPLKPGDACPDPLAHTGSFAPLSGRPRHGGYKTVEQIDAEAAEAARRRP